MRKIITLCMAVCCTIISSVNCEPKLEITDQRFDFGSIPDNSVVYKHFWFKSTGTDTLIINNIKTGCACALMETIRDTLPPGDSIKVGIEWKIGNKLHGIGRYPYIYTNASPDPYRIYLTGNAYKSLDELIPVSITPYKFEFPKYKGNSVDEIKFTLTNHSQNEIRYELITELPEEIEFELPELIKPNSTAEGKIKIKKEFRDTEFQSSVTIVSLDNKRTKMTIPIRRVIFDK